MKVRFRNLFFKLSMFISSYFPLYIILIISNWNFIFPVYKIVLKRTGTVIIYNTNGISFFIVLIVLSIFSIIVVLLFLFHKPEANNIIISNVEPSKDTVISYIVTYVVPLLSLDPKSGTSIIVNVFLFLLIGLLYIKLDLFYLNPIMALAGYVPYFANDKVIISNASYHDIHSRVHRKWRGTHISSNIIIIRKEDNL